MADRIVILSQGRILQVGTPEVIYGKPISPEVAQQLGQPAINLVPAEKLGLGQGDALAGMVPEDIHITGGTTGHGESRRDLGPSVVLLADVFGQEMRSSRTNHKTSASAIAFIRPCRSNA